MKIGFVGLGKMGYNLALNAIDNKWDIVGFDVSEEIRLEAKKAGIKTVNSIGELLEELEEKKVIFLSTPAGEITNNLIKNFKELLKENDIVIDSGNSNFNDTLSNYKLLKEKGIHFLDCGTSGGKSGARNGACLMIGGEEKPFREMEEFFKSIATENGYLYTKKPGSGHYLKMIHNGIEYGMMQAIGEGFDILNACQFEYDFEEVSKVWNNGSVIRSWLIELAEEGFAKDKKLNKIKGVIDANGEAKWTVEEALRLDIPAPVIATSLFVRNNSKIDDSFSNKVVATLRNGFGGHDVYEK
ncbi:phosphogluconate dehydrogenase (NAD(+)-dependent, decarboxylating) [Oceanivirga salmonicida]|uniref:phosphogluconate dehydrogenase (NAD(+)-dependent, decarboxylating) n=1 Tax=Oceanivirga salmonicida TaxID=1769291 RepID=UPI0012E1D301|nr:decarboxylating 6-phosphogluconate dehydrogenase [Oceanivirga salmonicida]